MSYNPDFTRNACGKFNVDNNFISVKNGGEAYLLEDELNEMQWIQNELRAQSMRSLISTGLLYTKLSILNTNSDIDDTIYTKSYGNTDLNTNAILFNIKNNIPINVNGYSFKLAGTYKKTVTGVATTNNNILVTLPAPPTSGTRKDLVYLEVWFEEINTTDNKDIKYLGGEDNSSISTFDVDDRIKDETTHRIQLKWAIKVAKGKDKLTSNIKPKDITTNIAYVKATSKTNKVYSKDTGLYVSEENNDGKTMNGIYYAIPLLVINRIANQQTIDPSDCVDDTPKANLTVDSFGSNKLVIGTGDDNDIALINNLGKLEIKKDKQNTFTDLTTNSLSLNDNVNNSNTAKFINNAGTVELKSSDGTTFSNLSVGDLTIKGTTTTIQSETVTIADNTIVLNSNIANTVAPTENSGIEVKRGNATNASLIWDETHDYWKCGLAGSEKPIILDIPPNSWVDITNKPTLISGYDSNFAYNAVAPTATNRLNYNGYLYATRIYNAVFNDYAEYFEKGQEAEPGDVIICNGDDYIKSNSAYSTLVVGVCSDTYGHLLGGNGLEDDDDNFLPIGLAGRVNVKVVGDVQKGDLLVASHIPGVAMKSEKYIPGTVIGKALQDHFGNNVDRIKMLISNM